MIRFVDIRGQGTGYRFAFWDTISDRFVEFEFDQAWHVWSDLYEIGIDRLKSLCPDCVFEEE